ncbi:hypothetical protein D0809_12480 [Flavobacterium circumlabens]|uniref:Lipoprotein n=1 Tax=Flavobacterium circumlabens TaxID=2133765 RepID=A0A4Y7UCZ7_9FLAO|nr:hypothetical protein [Flavobacterium circumlabens]TCN57385.1 hypothetical protein EV142_10441 [Flavobacterium circumlabens]TEB43709.1 hypothetical protein D0809_12480 [Flavobacterium circumlabens]
MSKSIKHLFTILIAGICLASCSSADEDAPDTNTDPLVKQIKFDGSNNGFPVNPSEINFLFEYDNTKRLTKKVGGYLALGAATGFDRIFSDKLYTSLVYSSNKVTVENFYDSDIYAVSKGTIYYTLNSANLIAEKEVPNTIAINTKKQVYKYAEGKLTEVVTSYPNMTYYPEDPTDYVLTFSEKFFYDANNNLTKTEYTELHNGKSEGERIVRTFEDYDTSYNPFKRMQLLEEYFYRSLSRNNFRKYTETLYYYDNVSTNETGWTFVYDAQGNIIVN